PPTALRRRYGGPPKLQRRRKLCARAPAEQHESSRSQQPFAVHELGVEDRASGRSANGVVPERDELEVENRTQPKATDRHRHATAPIDIERRLRSVGVGEIFDWLRGRRRQL